MMDRPTDQPIQTARPAQAGIAPAARPGVANPSLADLLDRQTVAGCLCRAEDGKVRCLACGHRCLIAPGRRGVCKVRFNADGQLRVPFGYVAGLACDPVEKKPFFHVLPGSDALTFGMLGCDFHCAYCQNWVTSQALRDAASESPVHRTDPEQLAAAAVREGARLVVSTYNEPLITAEWSAAVFEACKGRGLLCAFVSNGNATPEALDFIQPWISAMKIDLKTFNDRQYRALGGALDRVTETIREVHRRGLWLEIVTLLVPGMNDSEAELCDLTRFVASVSLDIPWHVTAFHPDYKMTEPRRTQAGDLLRAAEIGREAGLRFVYAGNLPGHVESWEDTRCPGCGATLIERRGFTVMSYRLSPAGGCPECGRAIPGRWPATGAAEVPTGGAGTAWLRGPRRARMP
jgi:pyruvate formate lyase activating enzyme